MNQPLGVRRAQEMFEEGRREFLAGRYFEAHDIWEELWQHLRGPDRLYLQGLIHLAVGAYHWGNKNQAGSRSQWQKAVQKLGKYPSGHWGVNVSNWVEWIEAGLGGGFTESPPTDLPFDPVHFPRHITLADG